jgi:multimeric flavodoxin WrbA
MKLLLMTSSARTHGNTARVMDLLEESLRALAQAQAIDLSMERVYLAKLSLKPCLGCRACFDRGESFCPQQDDLLSLYERMRQADGYIIASPVYVEDINGILKTMIDRMAFLCHRPALYGKSAMIFTTSGIGSSRHALLTMEKAFGTWGIRTTQRAQFRLGALTRREEIALRYGKKLSRLVTAFFRSVTQTPFRPSLYSLIAFTVQQALWSRKSVDHGTMDYRYWSESGWLNRGLRYYDPALARSCKAVAGRALGKLIALFFG